MVNFVSIPDPRKGPCDIAELANAQKYGAIPTSVTAFASPEHFIQIAQYDPLKESSLNGSGSQSGVGKWFCHQGARNNPAQYKYSAFEMIYWTGSCMPVSQLRHSPSAAIYDYSVVKCFEEFSQHFENGVPELVVITHDCDEARRLNFSATPWLPFPVGEGKKLRGNTALRLNAQTGKLEWFSIEEFMREYKSDVQAGRGNTGGESRLTWPQITKGFTEYLQIYTSGATDEQKAARFYDAAKR